MSEDRAGTFVLQPGGYKAFVPKPLPPDPPLRMDEGLWRRLSDADRALGRLDGATETLPNPDLFVAMYVRHEAVLSAQIEGTQATLTDLLEYEAASAQELARADVAEIVNHVDAMNYGLKRLETLPLSLRLIREIHEHLLKGVRGSQWPPGQFRTIQNLIGPPGARIEEATFVPPPPQELTQALRDLESFLHGGEDLPVLIFCGLMHAQFESIHPFMDGNGRIGRLLITFLLCQRKILRRPLLYLSYYFRQYRSDYYAALTRIREEGAWEDWLRFFLEGVYEVAQGATETSRRILALRDEHARLVREKVKGAMNGLKLLELLFQTPVVSVGMVRELLGVSHPTANSLVGQLSKMGLLHEITGGARNRLFSYTPYVSLFDQSVSGEAGVSTDQLANGNEPTMP